MSCRYGQGETMSLDELYCMLSIILTMCVHSTRDVQDHWSECTLLHNPFIKQTLPKHKFLQHWYNLRFCDHRNPITEVQNESNKYEDYLRDSTTYEKEKNIDSTLKRVQSLSNELQKQWALAFAKYIPSSKKFKYTIDESLLFFNGRVIFKVFNPMKPARFGIDFKVICNNNWLRVCLRNVQRQANWS
ncbi:Transposase_IS4 [Hexamita inflata]|uniref:Transposase IS4 n=1 Tax=Hexamita inflata TaxID=28002 RepID=A0AA86UFQ3_9EUKA|nr:Transposase IS4 [Hexamita inflata]